MIGSENQLASSGATGRKRLGGVRVVDVEDVGVHRLFRWWRTELADPVEHVVDVERLRHIAARTVGPAGPRRVVIGRGGQHHDGQGRRERVLPEAFEQLEAAHAGHHDVEQHAVRDVLADAGDGLHGIGGLAHLIAVELEAVAQQPANRLLVVDDQDVLHEASP